MVTLNAILDVVIYLESAAVLSYCTWTAMDALAWLVTRRVRRSAR